MAPLLIVRRVGAVVLVLAAIAVWFALAPDAPAQIDDRSAAIEVAMREYESNDAMADSAPQQQVTNGWVARDLLEIIAEQQNSAALAQEVDRLDPRVPGLIGLLVLGLALALGTSGPLSGVGDTR